MQGTDGRKPGGPGRTVGMTFAQEPGGAMEETADSVRRRVAARWGLRPEWVVLQETSARLAFTLGGARFLVCDSARFTVNGKGWGTDFKTLSEAPQYDSGEVACR